MNHLAWRNQGGLHGGGESGPYERRLPGRRESFVGWLGSQTDPGMNLGFACYELYELLPFAEPQFAHL